MGISVLAQHRHRLLQGFSCGVLVLGLTMLGTTSAGAIIHKPFVEPILSRPADNTAVSVVANTISYDPKTRSATATGQVVLVYGPYRLIATRVVYNQQTGAFKANGRVELHEPNGNILQAQTLALTDKFKAGFAEHLRALLTNDAVITAQYARRSVDGITVYEHATYSVQNCLTKDGKPIWQIITDKTTHDNVSHNLYHVNPKFQIAGHTVLALPYYQQPDPTVKRRSGFVSPALKFGHTIGAGAAISYFWAMAPNYDLTLTPLITTKGGVAGDVEWRHRLQTGQYNVHGFGAYDWSPDAASNIEKFRGAVTTEGQFAVNQDWSWGWNGTYATDQTFLDHYNYDSREIAENDIHATGLWDQTYISAQLLNYRSLNEDVAQSALPYALPFITGEKIIPDLAFGGDLKLSWNAYSLHRTAANTPFTTVEHATDQTHATGEMEWKTQLISEGGFVVSPFAKLRTDVTVTQNLPDPNALGGVLPAETSARILPTVGVDMRYPLIASYAAGQSIISPVFQLISAADESSANKIGNEDSITLNLDSSSIFLTDRFTGLDRYEGGTRANLGVTYSFLGNNGNFVKASAGESIHLAGKNSFADGSGLEGTQSDLVAALTVQPWEALSLNYQARIEEDFSKINRQEATASLTFDSFAANVSYLNFGAEPNYGRMKAEQWVAGDAKLQVSNGWYVFGGLAYDLNYNVLTKKTAGIEFDCDCMNMKLSYTGTEDAVTHNSDHRIMLSVDFATLGSSSATAKF